MRMDTVFAAAWSRGGTIGKPTFTPLGIVLKIDVFERYALERGIANDFKYLRCN